MFRGLSVKTATGRSTVWLQKKKLLLYRKYLVVTNAALIVLGFFFEIAGMVFVTKYEASFAWFVPFVGLGCQGFGVLGLAGTHGKGGHATNVREGGHRTSLTS